MPARLLLILLSCFASMAVSAIPASCEPVNSERRYEVGIGLQNVLPNGLPQMDDSLLLYGPVLTVPVYGQQLVLRGSYGAVDSFSGYLLEFSARGFAKLPFFTLYGVMGAQLFRYSKAGNSAGAEGGHLGMGLSFPMGRSNHWTLGPKVLVMRRVLWALDLQFSFTL